MKQPNQLILCLSLLTLFCAAGCKQSSQEPSNAENKNSAQKVTPENEAAGKKAEPNTVAANAKSQVTRAETAPEGISQAAPAPATCGGATEGGGCGGAVKPPTTADKATQGKRHFGGEFTLTESAVAVDQVIAKASDFSGKNIKVSARIAKVCRKKGCWMTLQPEANSEQYVRVTMKDYGFFVPVDCDGKTATVEGIFKSVELPEAQRKHLAEDGGDDPTKVTGKAMELSLVATAIDIE